MYTTPRCAGGRLHGSTFGTDGTTGTPYGGTDGHGATTVNAAEIAGNQRRHGDFTLKNVRKMWERWEIYGKYMGKVIFQRSGWEIFEKSWKIDGISWENHGIEEWTMKNYELIMKNGCYEEKYIMRIGQNWNNEKYCYNHQEWWVDIQHKNEKYVGNHRNWMVLAIKKLVLNHQK